MASAFCAASMASLNFELAAFIFAVGEQDHRLPSNFFRQHVVGGEIDGIVEHGAGLAPGAVGTGPPLRRESALVKPVLILTLFIAACRR